MKPHRRSVFGLLFDHLQTAVGAVVFTVAFFMVLPILQAISGAPKADVMLTQIETADVAPPPPPPPEEEKPEEQPAEEKPPELTEESPPLNLDQLELALNPGTGDGVGGDFVVKLGAAVSAANQDKDVEALFSLGDLDQKPRAVYQPAPVLTAETRKKAPGTVYILFVVDQDGKVESPIVQSATDPVFERPALAAVKQWKFEPGKRQGRPVRFRMRVPITFPQG